MLSSVGPLGVLHWRPPAAARQYTVVYLDCIEKLIHTARHLHHFSLGCVEQLQVHTPSLLPLLAQRHASTLHTLHLVSVKEDSQNYGIVDLSPADLTPFRRLHTLSLDYDYLNADVLLSMTEPDCTCLKKLLVHIHGVEPDHPHIDNATWRQVRRMCPELEVSLTLLHSYEGVGVLTSILQPSMPLVSFRQYFCSRVSVAAICFLGSQLSEVLRELEIVEGMPGGNPLYYDTSSPEDPFVMLAWRCSELHTLRLIG
nr:hypothetical protein BaRGS_028223 [Batillaria attramentaria]